MRRTLAIGLGLAICGLPLLALAGPPGEIPPAVMKKVLKEKVGLSDAQLGKIQKLQYRFDGEKIDIQHDMQRARLDLEQLMQAETPDQAKVFAQIDKLGALETRLKKNRIGLMLEIRKLVSPGQWQKMEELHAARKMKRRERMRHRRFGGPEAPLPPEPPPAPPAP